MFKTLLFLMGYVPITDLEKAVKEKEAAEKKLNDRPSFPFDIIGAAIAKARHEIVVLKESDNCQIKQCKNCKHDLGVCAKKGYTINPSLKLILETLPEVKSVECDSDVMLCTFDQSVKVEEYAEILLNKASGFIIKEGV